MNEGKWQHLCLGQVGLQSRTLCSPRQRHFPVSGVSPTPSRGLALSQPAFCLGCCKQQFHHFLQKHNFPLLSPCPLNTPVLPQPTRWCWSCTVFINPLFQTTPQWQSASSAAGVLRQVGVTPVPRDIPLLFKGDIPLPGLVSAGMNFIVSPLVWFVIKKGFLAKEPPKHHSDVSFSSQTPPPCSIPSCVDGALIPGDNLGRRTQSINYQSRQYFLVVSAASAHPLISCHCWILLVFPGKGLKDRKESFLMEG